MQECESSFLLREMEIVGNSIAETGVAMELCQKVQAEEYVIHVEESTSVYTHLRFFLLASTWFPRRVGVCLWSALHVFLVLYEALVLLVLFSTGFVLAVLWDASMVVTFIYLVLCLPFLIIGTMLCIIIAVVLAVLWLVITCQWCTMPGRAPGQGLVDYIFTAGPRDPQPEPVVEGGAAAASGPPTTFLQEIFMIIMTPKFVRHVFLVSFPYRRAQLGDLRREIVPWYDTIVM